MQFSQRESIILKKLEKGEFSISEILLFLEKSKLEVSKITLNRDLKHLEKLNLVRKSGKAKATKYKLTTRYHIFKEVNFAEYFSVDFDDRKVIEGFNFEVYDALKDLFIEEEKSKFDDVNLEYRKKVSETSPGLLKKELERLMIELSWKSSRLEGNTYDLLDTEILIKEKLEAKNHTKEEAIMILNHKKALDFAFGNKQSFLELSPKLIIKLHKFLVEGLEIKTGFREKKVGIIGTKYKPLAKGIEKAVSLLCDLVNSQTYPLSKALIVFAMMSYIQAFEDGNKRTARILATAILLAYDYCPISYRKVDDYDYKKAIILFYEQNNIVFLKKIFEAQFEFSVNEYF